MKHLDYVELLTNPLAGGGGGGGITPSGSITINKNTNGVDVTDKATAVVAVQGGLDADYVPYVIPTGYTEYPCVDEKTRLQIETYDPEGASYSAFYVMYDEDHPVVPAHDSHIAITGVTSDTHDPYMVVATTAGATTPGTGKQRVRVVYDQPPTFGVGNPVMDITANGNNIDVKGRNAVNVNVPSSASGSVTFSQNTSNLGADISGKATAIVACQGALDYDFVQPYVPEGYTEVQATSGPAASTVKGYKAGQTNKQISARIPLSVTLTNGDKIAISGTTNDTGDAFIVAGTVSGKTTYSTYQYAKITVDYDGMVGVTNASVTLKSNGTHDVKGRNSAVVSVHGTGTLYITQNGITSCDGYADVDVQVQGSGGSNITRLDGLTLIPQQAFLADSRTPNTGITALQLPDVVNIGDTNFVWFAALTEVAIGKNCQMIGNGCFGNCPNLVAIAFDKQVWAPPQIQYPPDIPQDCAIYVQDNALQTWQQATGWSQIAQKIHGRQGMPWSETFGPFDWGDIVTHNGDMWECTGSYVTGEPGVDPNWAPYTP